MHWKDNANFFRLQKEIVIVLGIALLNTSARNNEDLQTSRMQKKKTSLCIKNIML